MGRRRSASSARTTPATKRIICCRSLRGWCWVRTTSTITAPPISRRFASALAGKQNATASMRDVFNAPAILLIGNDPTNQHPLLAWQIRSNVRLHRAKLYVANSSAIKLHRQATAFAQIAAGSEGSFVQFLAGNDKAADTRRLAERHARGAHQVARWAEERNGPGHHLRFGAARRRCQDAGRFRPGARTRSSSAWAITPTRAARPTWGSIPTCCRATRRFRARRSFHEEWLDEIPATPGMNLLQMVDAAKNGKLKALYVVGSNPVARYNIDPFALSKSFVIVQDMFLTETASIADVVLPVANAYEKSGTLHQHLRRRADAEEGRRVCGRAQRLRVHRAHRGAHGIRRPQAGALRRRAARAPTWDRRAARNRASPTGTRFGWRVTTSSRR